MTLRGLVWDEARLVQGQWLALAQGVEQARERIERPLGESCPEGQASLP
ncbi:hypothetical protein DEIPH_ctg139orf0125 [Deinococcus phoenicis]|uniref:Uncharacterized protein n=1 Tax=Deinococcus phoenicis TaxID=1476583 RepID=A0A016QKT2_9DEIO|nr:hypothetical protein [Deinococcus phoenicis]EYB66399.1 hypothetical protein DEIPH_ctg139orf0125 [Deinococcus phoenicis]